MKNKVKETLTRDNIEEKILEKFQFQWKTLRKAFMDLNIDKQGAIMPEELRYYLKFWGLELTDQ